MVINTKKILQKNRNNLLREVYFRVGRNLLLFQKIESRLKIITPHLSLENGEVRITLPDSLEKLLAQSNSNRMLGLLVRDLKLATQSDDSSNFHEYLTFVLKERNKFIHDLENNPEFGVHSVKQCEGSINYLDRQHKICSPLLAFADELSKAALRVMSNLDEIE